MTAIDARLSAALARLAREAPGDAGFLERIERAQAFFGAVPELRELAFDATRRPRGGEISREEAERLFPAVHGFLAFLCYGVSWQVRDLVDDVVSGLAQARYLRAFGAARALVERAAVVHATHAELAPRFVALLGRRGSRHEAAIVHCHRVLWRFAAATRFNWEAGMRGDLESFYDRPDAIDPLVEVTHIHDLLDLLPQPSKGDVRWYYGVLCDFVHPNGPSHGLSIDAWRDGGGGERRFTLSYRPKSEQSLLNAMHALAIPVREALVFLEEELRELFEGLTKIGMKLGEAR